MAELEEKCLKWLIDNSEEILKSNECLDEVLEDLASIQNQLTAFTHNMSTYLSSVTVVHNDTVRLTQEANQTSEIVKRLEDYVASITITPEAERALTSGDIESATEDSFWIHIKELYSKLALVTKLLDRPVDDVLQGKYQINELDSEPVSEPIRRMDRFESLMDARAKLADLDSVVKIRLRNYAQQQIVKSFSSSAPLAGSRQRFFSLTKRVYDTLSERNAHHLCQDILNKYVSTVSSLHYNQVCEYFQVIRCQVPKAEYSETDLRRGLLALGFQLVQSPFFERGGTPGILPAAITGGAQSTSTGSQLVSMLINTVLPSQPLGSNEIRRDTIPLAESTNGRINSLFGTVQEIRQRLEVLKDVRKPAFPLQHYQKTGQTAYKEEVLRSILMAILDIGQQELQFVSDYFFTHINDQHSTLLSLSSASEPLITSDKSASNSETWNPPPKPMNPVKKVFDRVFSTCLSQALKEINQILILTNCDLVSLVIMSRIVSYFLDACRKESLTFIENLLINLSNSLNRHVTGLVDTIINTIMHNNKPQPNSHSEMFARKGVDETEFPSSSTVQTLLETLLVCALGGLTDKSEAAKAALIGLYDDITLNPTMSAKILRVYGDVSYAAWVVSEFKGEKSHLEESPALQILEDTEQWANGYRVKLTECLALDLINRVRPDFQDTIKAAEAQMSMYGEISDATQIKLAKFTNADFLGDLQKLSSALLPQHTPASGGAASEGIDGASSYELYKSRLRKDVMTKYAILYSRYMKALSQTTINVDRLPSPEQLVSETRALMEMQESLVEPSANVGGPVSEPLTAGRLEEN